MSCVRSEGRPWDVRKAFEPDANQDENDTNDACSEAMMSNEDVVVWISRFSPFGM